MKRLGCSCISSGGPMVNVSREPLHGEVERDDTWVGGSQQGLRRSRQLKGRKAALVAVAVEKRGTRTGRARMAVIPDFKATTLLAFIKQAIAPGSTIYTDRSEERRVGKECRSRRGPDNYKKKMRRY